MVAHHFCTSYSFEVSTFILPGVFFFFHAFEDGTTELILNSLFFLGQFPLELRAFLHFAGDTLFLFFFCHWSFIEVEALEHANWKNLNNKCPKDLTSSTIEAKEILLSKWW